MGGEEGLMGNHDSRFETADTGFRHPKAHFTDFTSQYMPALAILSTSRLSLAVAIPVQYLNVLLYYSYYAPTSWIVDSVYSKHETSPSNPSLGHSKQSSTHAFLPMPQSPNHIVKAPAALVCQCATWLGKRTTISLLYCYCLNETYERTPCIPPQIFPNIHIEGHF